MTGSGKVRPIFQPAPMSVRTFYIYGKDLHSIYYQYINDAAALASPASMNQPAGRLIEFRKVSQDLYNKE